MTPGHVGSKSTDPSHLYPYSIEKMFDFWDPTENSEDQICLCEVGMGVLRCPYVIRTEFLREVPYNFLPDIVTTSIFIEPVSLGLSLPVRTVDIK